MCTAYPDSVFRSLLPMQNPVLLNTQLNIKYSSLETKYKKQLLLPQLDLKYNMLSTPNSNPIGSFTPFSDYQFRIKFGSSLILRKERGDYQMAKIKQENAALKYDFKLVEVNNKSKSLWQQRLIYKQVYNQAQATVSGYQELYNAELIRLESGESTIFMVNTREMKMLENDLKVLQIGRKYWTSNVDYLENAGLLWQIIN
jgi:outer membrane protein TolC